MKIIEDVYERYKKDEMFRMICLVNAEYVGTDQNGGKSFKFEYGGHTFIIRHNKDNTYTWIS